MTAKKKSTSGPAKKAPQAKAAKATKVAKPAAAAKRARRPPALREVRSVKDAVLAGELPAAFERQAKSSAAGGPVARSAAAVERPIGDSSARKVTRWLMEHFGQKLLSAGTGTPFEAHILCAIVCQETAYFWLPLLTSLEQSAQFKNNPNELADLILARCVLDASGDHPDSPRSAFPKNTEAFRKRFGDDFTALLIAEANATRALRGYGPKQWVYKGYGLFQYDLQFVVENEDFFRERRWYDFDACLANCLKELKSKYAAVGRDLWEAVRAYNGSGPRARAYRDNVRHYAAIAAAEIGTLAPAGSGRSRAVQVPKSKPQLTQAALAARLARFEIDRTEHPLIVVGIRGYYLDTMGKPGVNDRGIYDDALFIDAPDAFATFNGNTDPSRDRPGVGTGESKGIARLKAGLWMAHKLDFHGSAVKGPYRAICQRLGKVTVIRDGADGKDYEDTGNFGINIHCGSSNGTSSLGCQTLHPDQWPSFINLVVDLAKRYYGARWDKKVIPYVLIEE